MEHLYKTEADPDVKERLLLVLKVEGDEMIPARIAKELHRSRTWASDWLLARYKKEGVEGLKDRHKSGRPSKLPLEIAVKIKKKLKESKQQGWTTKQVNEMIVKDGRVRYHHIYIYTLLHKWGFSRKYQGRYMLIPHLKKRKKDSKKNEGNIIRQPC